MVSEKDTKNVISCMEEFLTPQEVATRLRVTAYTVRRWIATGVLEAETIKERKCNRHRFSKSIVLELCELPPVEHIIMQAACSKALV